MDGQGIIRGSFGEVSNRADWLCDIDGKWASTNDDIDFSLATSIEVQIQDVNNAPLLSATKANGKITIPQTGTFRFSFLLADMSTLKEETHNIGIRMTYGGVIYPLFVATVDIIEGHVI